MQTTFVELPYELNFFYSFLPLLKTSFCEYCLLLAEKCLEALWRYRQNPFVKEILMMSYTMKISFLQGCCKSSLSTSWYATLSHAQATHLFDSLVCDDCRSWCSDSPWLTSVKQSHFIIILFRLESPVWATLQKSMHWSYHTLNTLSYVLYMYAIIQSLAIAVNSY